MDPAWLSEDLLSTLTASPAAGLDADQLSAALAALKSNEVWNLRARARERMIDGLRARGLSAADSDAMWMGWVGGLDADARAGLLLSDLARLERLLDDPVNAVRMVIVGRPRDAAGELVRARLEELADSARFSGRLLLLCADDLEAQRIVVHGVDLWLDASSAPGLRAQAASNGALVYARASQADDATSNATPDAAPLAGGWSLSPLAGFDDQAGQDEHDAREMFERLEREIMPCFYDWNPQAVPGRWVERVRASMRAGWAASRSAPKG